MKALAHLILIKHAMPQISPVVASPLWPLSEQGRYQCRALADSLTGYALQGIVTSTEPKAQETAAILASQLGLDYETALGLHENDRTGFPFLDTASWKAAFVEFFGRPDELVIGNETAKVAQQRFIQAVDGVLDKYVGKNIAIVTHGTVLSLFVASFNAIEPFGLWERMACPSFVVMSLPERRLVTTVSRIDSP